MSGAASREPAGTPCPRGREGSGAAGAGPGSLSAVPTLSWLRTPAAHGCLL